MKLIIWAKFGLFRGYCLGGYYQGQGIFKPTFIMVSSDVCTLSYRFVIFWDQLSANCLKIARFVWGKIGLGCHFSRDDFLGIFRFFDFNRLPSKTAVNLVVPSLSLMCIFLPAFWPSSAQSLVPSACEA